MHYWSPTVNLSIGKWWTPVIGTRIQGNSFGLLDVSVADQRGDFDIQYFNVHGDAMFNLNNLFASYNPDRFFTITPFLGVGYAKTLKIKVHDTDNEWKKQKSNGNVTANAGILFGFRLSSAVDLNLEVQGTVVGDKFNGYVVKRSYDGLAAASLGLTYKFKKRNFETCPVPDDSEIQRLLAENSKLRNDLDACLKKPAPTCPPCPTCPKQEPVVVQDCPTAAIGVVRFALGSTVIKPEQQINVFNAADYLKNNPGVKVQVVGHADVKTGNPTINLKLSEQRAKAVAKMLVDKYGIPEKSIEVSWNGDKVQPFETNEWNRVVIFIPQK